MRFCSLEPQYSLRGWIGMPFALRSRDTVKRLERNEFNALVICDGQRDLDTIKLTDSVQHALRSFEQEGIVRFHDEPRALQPDQYYRLYDARYFKSVIWSITGRCNFRCRHCYLDAPGAAFGELSTEEAFSIIDQMAECGIHTIEVTGGEPLVRKDFWQLVDRLCGKGIIIDQVYTNGWLLTGEILDGFANRSLKPEFSISFDGLGWHDWMRRTEGAEEKVLRAIRLCRERGFPTNIEMCLHKGNRDTLRETVLKMAEAGTGNIKCSPVMNTPLWLEHSGGNHMTIREYCDTVLEYIPRYYEDGAPIDLLLSGVAWLYKGSEKYVPVAEFGDGSEKCLDRHICGATRASCYIGPDGRLLPCMPIASSDECGSFPKVQEIGLKQAFKDSGYMEYVDRRVKDLLEVCKTCRECPYHLKCGGGCRATAVMEGEKNLMGPDPFRCLMWKDGYLDKLHEVCDAAIAKHCKKQ